MDHQPKAYELPPRDLDIDLQPSGNRFETTNELEPLEEIVGQPRAEEALELGLGIDDSGFNIYAAGMSGLGKQSLLHKVLMERAVQRPVPGDWIYVNNFDHPEQPIAIGLPPGSGTALKRDLKSLVDRLKEELPKAFQREDFSNERKVLTQHYNDQVRDLLQQLQETARSAGFVAGPMPDGGLFIAPEKDGRPMEAEEFNALTENEKENIEKKRRELFETGNQKLEQRREIERRLHDDVRRIERDFADRLFSPAIDEIIHRYEGEKLGTWLERMKTHMLDNLRQFQERGEDNRNQFAALIESESTPAGELDNYDVNIVVDNGGRDHAPLVVENSPNYKNLFGMIQGVSDRMGRVMTSFHQIKAGSILRANGGFLMFDLMEALIEPLVWKELKRTIKSGMLEYHMYDPFGVFGISSLRPEPIPIKLKLVVYGSPLVYYLLQLYDEDFLDIFKVKADFAEEMNLDGNSHEVIGRFVGKLQRQDNSIQAFNRDGICELVRVAVRMADDKDKISTAFKRIEDVARESNFWAKKDHSAIVTARHVRQAIDRKVFRSDLIAERMREMIANGTLLISTEGSAIGQINGLSVIALGDLMFGRPSRLTAGIGVGTGGLINIERESKLSGSTFDKAMLILEGYMRNTYGAQHPLGLTVSIVMEQSYGMIEGDSASVAELLCLLSACAQAPLRQDIGVTGSVNQWGHVQAIGGVNAKIEGFYDACRAMGPLSGSQGVCIPASNIRNCVLRPDVIEAVRAGSFHVWAVDHIDQALELLTGVPAGSIQEEGTIHWMVDQRLQGMLDLLDKHRSALEPRETLLQGVGVHGGPHDPRPPLPGRDSRHSSKENDGDEG